MTPERIAALPGKRKSGEVAIAVMERHLGTCRFFVGERYTIADIALYAYTHVAHEGDLTLRPIQPCGRGSSALPPSRAR